MLGCPTLVFNHVISKGWFCQGNLDWFKANKTWIKTISSLETRFEYLFIQSDVTAPKKSETGKSGLEKVKKRKVTDATVLGKPGKCGLGWINGEEHLSSLYWETPTFGATKITSSYKVISKVPFFSLLGSIWNYKNFKRRIARKKHRCVFLEGPLIILELQISLRNWIASAVKKYVIVTSSCFSYDTQWASWWIQVLYIQQNVTDYLVRYKVARGHVGL